MTDPCIEASKYHRACRLYCYTLGDVKPKRKPKKGGAK